MSNRLLRGLFTAAVSLMALLPASANVRITLKNGQVVDVPISPEEIQSIIMEPGRTGAPVGLPPAPVEHLPAGPSFVPGSPLAPADSSASQAPKSGATFIAPPPAKPAPPPAARTAAAPAATSAAPEGNGRLQVGATRELRVPSQAAAKAKSGDVIEIDAGTYRGDVAAWRASGITIRGVGGRVRLVADGNSAEGKAIWVTKGRDITIENIEFTGAVVPDGNGAGIRAEGVNLTIIGCYFHDNQEGILTTDNPDGIIDIENSEFARNGGNGGLSHEIYINRVKELIVRGSYFHEGREGHLIKTRALKSVIVGNRITNEKGNASYKIDVPNGGQTFIIGNMFEQSPNDDNHTIIAYDMEGPVNDNQELYIVNNTLVNDLGQGTFIASRSSVPAKVFNNIFVGGGNLLRGAAELRNNVLVSGRGGAPKIEKSLFDSGDLKESGTKTASDAGLVDLTGFDWHLKEKSPAIGAGIDPGSAGGMSLAPSAEYIHPASSKSVKAGGTFDAGAYQFRN